MCYFPWNVHEKSWVSRRFQFAALKAVATDLPALHLLTNLKPFWRQNESEVTPAELTTYLLL